MTQHDLNNRGVSRDTQAEQKQTLLISYLKLLQDRRPESARIPLIKLRSEAELRAWITKGRRRIALPPGATLNRLTRFLLTREAHCRYVEPIICDMQVEYCDELAAGHIGHARWIAIRGHLLVLPNWAYAWIARTLKAVLPSL